MIDFRYHVVSIIAVFLALGTGIVLGSTALDRPIIDDLKRRTEGLASDKAGLQDEVETLSRTVDADQEFATAIARIVLPGRLTGQRVTVVSATDAPKEVRDSVAASVRLGGGRVVSQVRLLPRFTDPAVAAEIDDLLARLPQSTANPPSGTLPRAAARLAEVLDAEGAADADDAPATTIQVVSGFREAGLIEVDGPSVLPGDVVLMLLGPRDQREGEDADAAREREIAAMVEVVGAFAGRSAVVLAAPPGAAVPGTVLNAVRDNAALAARLSTVDSAGEPGGNIATVLALADAVRREFGHYGTGPDADAPVPVLEPAAA